MGPTVAVITSVLLSSESGTLAASVSQLYILGVQL